jgi:hypothetical protein
MAALLQIPEGGELGVQILAARTSMQKNFLF